MGAYAVFAGTHGEVLSYKYVSIFCCLVQLYTSILLHFVQFSPKLCLLQLGQEAYLSLHSIQLICLNTILHRSVGVELDLLQELSIAPQEGRILWVQLQTLLVPSLSLQRVLVLRAPDHPVWSKRVLPVQVCCPFVHVCFGTAIWKQL